MDDVSAKRLLADTQQALATHQLSGEANVNLGNAADGSGAAVLLWLGYGHEAQASSVLAALEDSGLTAVPHTPTEGPFGEIVDRLAVGETVEVERPGRQS